MENIILLPYAGQLTRRVRREAEVIARLRKGRAFVQDRSDVRVDRSKYVVAINRPAERIYGLANLVAVVVMATALVTAFAMYLTSFVG
jgi:hypothetical protein